LPRSACSLPSMIPIKNTWRPRCKLNACAFRHQDKPSYVRNASNDPKIFHQPSHWWSWVALNIPSCKFHRQRPISVANNLFNSSTTPRRQLDLYLSKSKGPSLKSSKNLTPISQLTALESLP
jgi:hypothetical protein